MLDFLKNGKGEVLNLFYKDPDKEYFFREIARNLKKEPGAIQNALDTLVKGGILIDERKGNLRFFKLNKNHPLYEEIKGIISKTIGVEYKLKKLTDELKDIKHAFIFGSVAKNKEYAGSDIDIMLIGRVDHEFLSKKIDKIEQELEREVNYQVFDEKELLSKLKNKEAFFVRILSEPTILLKGDLYDFTKFIG